MTKNLTILGVFVLTSALLIGHTTTPAAGAAKAEANKWEYITESVGSATLQDRLSQLGKAGWEVFSVTRSDSVLENQQLNQPRIRVTNFQVTAKRAAE